MELHFSFIKFANNSSPLELRDCFIFKEKTETII